MDSRLTLPQALTIVQRSKLRLGGNNRIRNYLNALTDQMFGRGFGHKGGKYREVVFDGTSKGRDNLMKMARKFDVQYPMMMWMVMESDHRDKLKWRYHMRFYRSLEQLITEEIYGKCIIVVRNRGTTVLVSTDLRIRRIQLLSLAASMVVNDIMMNEGFDGSKRENYTMATKLFSTEDAVYNPGKLFESTDWENEMYHGEMEEEDGGEDIC